MQLSSKMTRTLGQHTRPQSECIGTVAGGIETTGKSLWPNSKEDWVGILRRLAVVDCIGAANNANVTDHVYIGVAAVWPNGGQTELERIEK